MNLLVGYLLGQIKLSQFLPAIMKHSQRILRHFQARADSCDLGTDKAEVQGRNKYTTKVLRAPEQSLAAKHTAILM